MKAILKKQIHLHSVIVYLKIQRDVERKDIQEYLNGKHFSNVLIERRVKEYLKNIKVYDEKYQLTELGNRVKISGKLPTPEEGVYQIWFTKQDSYFGNKIFYFKRISAAEASNSNNERLYLSFDDDDEHLCLPIDSNSFSKFKLLSIGDYFGRNIQQTNSITLEWHWDGLNTSYYIFNGELQLHLDKQDKKQDNLKIKNDEIPCNTKLDVFISNILLDWNKSMQRLKVHFDKISDQAKVYFEFDCQTNWNEFQLNFYKLPIMPHNLEEAKKWRDWLLINSLKKEYLNTADFQSIAIETNEKTSFSLYSSDLGIPDSQLFSNLIKKDILAFWHFQAPIDLNPNTKMKLSAKPIQLKQYDSISVQEIVGKIDLEDFKENSVCIYYDRYVLTEHQQKTAAALLDAIQTKNKIVITQIQKKTSDFIQKHRPDIKLKDAKTLFKNLLPHDRYLVVANKDKTQVWSITNSLTYIKFSTDNIDKNTKGTITQSVTFTPVDKEVLDNSLLKLLENEIKNLK